MRVRVSAEEALPPPGTPLSPPPAVPEGRGEVDAEAAPSGEGVASVFRLAEGFGPEGVGVEVREGVGD